MSFSSWWWKSIEDLQIVASLPAAGFYALHWLAFPREKVLQESPLYPVDLVLWVSPQPSDQRVILDTYPLLLRRDWADWRRWPFRKAIQCFHCCHWSVLTSFHFPCFLNLPSPRHWYHGILDDRILRNSATFSLHFCPKIHLVCHREYHFFSDPCPKKDQWRWGNLGAYV